MCKLYRDLCPFCSRRQDFWAFCKANRAASQVRICSERDDAAPGPPQGGTHETQRPITNPRSAKCGILTCQKLFWFTRPLAEEEKEGVKATPDTTAY